MLGFIWTLNDDPIWVKDGIVADETTLLQDKTISITITEKTISVNNDQKGTSGVCVWQRMQSDIQLRIQAEFVGQFCFTSYCTGNH